MAEKTKTEVKGATTVKVKLPRIQGAEDPVFVSVNDYTCLIKRGKEVEVPDFVAAALEDQERMLDTIEANRNATRYDD